MMNARPSLRRSLWFIAAYVLAASFSTHSTQAQQSDLTVTLPSGKTITFQSPEQKSRYEAALARRANTPATAPATVASSPATASSTSPANSAAARAEIGSSLSLPANVRPGVVNPDAPAFTAEYYTGVPESWVGKKIALSVGYITSLTEAPDQNGYRKFSASTWNHAPNTSLGDRSGGQITVFVKAENALKLMQLCGTSFRWGSAGWARTSIIHGEFRRMADPPKETAMTYSDAVKGYCVYVD